MITVQKQSQNVILVAMRLKNIFRITCVAGLFMAFASSCTQDEGFGGNSHIKGVMIEKYYNEDSTMFLYELPAKDEDVYLLFGEQNNVGEDTKTSYTGNFQFQYLWPGNYKLYYYSDDFASKTNEKKEIVIDFNLEKNQTFDFDTIYTYKLLDWDEGSSKIKGVLIEKYYNEDSTVFQFELPAKDEDVFIMFGDQKNLGDDTKTTFTGNFQFQNLWPGNYKLYYYSDNLISNFNKEEELIVDINLDENQTVDLDSIYTYKLLDWDEGSAKIKGNVRLINYKNESTATNLIVKDTTAAQEQEVYIVYNYADFYCDRVDTQADGSFVFDNVLKGHYRIYVFSENVRSNETGNIIKEIEFDIISIDQEEVIEDIYIEKI